MMVAVAELDRLSLMADAAPLSLFAARQLPIAPSNTPSGIPFRPPATLAPAESVPAESAPGAADVEKGEKPPPASSPASTAADFASFPAFVRTPSPMARSSPLQMARSRPPQGFLPLLSGPPKAGEFGSTSSSAPTSLMTEVEGTRDALATPAPPPKRPGTAVVDKGETPPPPPPPSAASTSAADFASFPAFVRAPLQMARSRPPQGFLSSLSGPPKAGEAGGTSSSAPTSVMSGVEGMGGAPAAVGKPDAKVVAGGGGSGGGDAVRARSLNEAGGRRAIVGTGEGSDVGGEQERASTLPGGGGLGSVGKESKK